MYMYYCIVILDIYTGIVETFFCILFANSRKFTVPSKMSSNIFTILCHCLVLNKYLVIVEVIQK